MFKRTKTLFQRFDPNDVDQSLEEEPVDAIFAEIEIAPISPAKVAVLTAFSSAHLQEAAETSVLSQVERQVVSGPSTLADENMIMHEDPFKIRMNSSRHANRRSEHIVRDVYLRRDSEADSNRGSMAI